MLNLPAFKAAAVQASPVFLDTPATIDKVCDLIREAASNGASLIVFPEVFVPAYPYWSWVASPVAASPWFQRLCEAAVEVPGPEFARIAQTAKTLGVHVAIGINERSVRSVSLLYNTMLLIGPDGRLLGRHAYRAHHLLPAVRIRADVGEILGVEGQSTDPAFAVVAAEAVFAEERSVGVG